MAENTNSRQLDWLDKIILFFCRLGFAGKMPVMPGTWGTALACLIAPLVFLPFDFLWRIIILAALFVLGGLAADRAEKVLDKKDPEEVVIDELVGVWLALLPFAHPSLWMMIAAFIAFRFFDILKPWPISASEKWLPGGFGVMIDDVIAGIFAMICLLIMDFLNWF